MNAGEWSAEKTLSVRPKSSLTIQKKLTKPGHSHTNARVDWGSSKRTTWPGGGGASRSWDSTLPHPALLPHCRLHTEDTFYLTIRIYNYRILAPKYVPRSAPVFYCYRCFWVCFVFIIFIIPQVKFSFPKEPFESSSYTDLQCAAGSKTCSAWRCLLFGSASWALGKLQALSILKL